MARKKRPESAANTDGWLATYADMVTLLMCFFVLLYSMSSVDSAKFNMLVSVFATEGESSDKIIIRGEVSGDPTKGANVDGFPATAEQLEDVYLLLQQLLKEDNLDSSVEVSRGDGFVFIRFMDNMLFEPNSAILKPQDKEILNFVGTGIKMVQSETNSINIVGHTAAIPGDPDYAVSDRTLSTDRANAVLVYFEDVVGIDPEKLFAAGYGKQKPLASNETEEGRSQNRRVEILISAEGNTFSEQLDNVYEKLLE